MTRAPKHLRHWLSDMAWLGAGIGITVSIGICAALGYHHIRAMTLSALQSRTHFIASLVATSSNEAQAQAYLQMASKDNAFTLICAYDASNNLIASWPHMPNHCPLLMITQGMEVDGANVTIAELFKEGGKYDGMVYTTARIGGLGVWFLGAGAILLVSTVLCGLISRLIAFRVAERLNQQFTCISSQIQCLKGEDIDACVISTEHMMGEIAAVSQQLLALRFHLNDTMMAADAAEKQRRWPWDVMSGLLASLRYRLLPDSALLDCVDDYALLVQSERHQPLPPPKLFDIDVLLDKSIALARKTLGHALHVNLTASIQAGMPKRWEGQPDLIEALLRHLLLMGLKRTQAGFVVLRLEYQPLLGLRIILEDSGERLQPWQLEQWLANYAESSSSADDISWLLVPRLIKRLKGDVTASYAQESGLTVQGSIPLQLHEVEHSQPVGENDELVVPATKFALIVEQQLTKQERFCHDMAEAHCQAFVVSTHEQALEWAMVLPFDVIVLNDALRDLKISVAQRLQHSKKTEMLRDIPVWLISRRPPIETNHWRELGIDQLLQMPLLPKQLRDACASVAPSDRNFFHAHNQKLRSEFPPAIMQSLDKINCMLSEQIAMFLPQLALLAQGELLTSVNHDAHAIKSAALNLGYFRLAALMSQIEYAIAARKTFRPQNWALIAQCLEEAGFKELYCQLSPAA